MASPHLHSSVGRILESVGLEEHRKVPIKDTKKGASYAADPICVALNKRFVQLILNFVYYNACV